MAFSGRPSGVVRAVVDAGDTSTPYARAGCGRPVVLLHGGADDVADTSLFGALAERCRVLAPAPPGGVASDAAAFADWLRGFLDGLGVTEVTLVAPRALGDAALSFVASDGGRVARVVLLSTGPSAADDVIRVVHEGG